MNHASIMAFLLFLRTQAAIQLPRTTQFNPKQTSSPCPNPCTVPKHHPIPPANPCLARSQLTLTINPSSYLLLKLSRELLSHHHHANTHYPAIPICNLQSQFPIRTPLPPHQAVGLLTISAHHHKPDAMESIAVA
ncbi:hypothetical protein M0R45_001698 [Rubus argutus]|uniref:Uncharacterized protein n=1 Tax=Rubus argutus TaxID=59490 RepID=A0AAW1VLU8_RUBAR